LVFPVARPHWAPASADRSNQLFRLCIFGEWLRETDPDEAAALAIIIALAVFFTGSIVLGYG